MRELLLLAPLSLEQCSLLLEPEPCSSRAGRRLFVIKQEYCELLFLLRSGLARVRIFIADGQEVMMALLSHGDV